MKPWSQIVATLALVLVALLLYDLVRAGPGAPPGAPDSVPRRPETPAAPAPLLDPPPLAAVLEGTGDELWRARIERRLDELEAELGRLEGRPSVAGAGSGTPPIAPGSGAAGDLGAEGSEESADGAAPGGAPPADPVEARRAALQRFRTMLEAVERQRARESAAAKIDAFFGKIDLALSDEQRRRAVGVTLEYQGRWAKIAGAPAKTDEQIEARRTAFSDLWGEYGRALEDVIPRAESDKILAALQQVGAQRR